MKPPPRVILLALLLCAPAAASARVSNKPERPRGLASPSSEPRVQLGLRGLRTGLRRTVEDHPKRMSWKTPFSPCPASAYTLVERRRKGAATLWTYRFIGSPRSCLYKVVVLEKTAPPDVWAWNAYGFTSMKAYRAGSKDQLSCYLVKAD